MAGYENVILLDTNILIEVFKGNTSVISSVQQAGPENLALSSVTAMELYYKPWGSDQDNPRDLLLK